MNDDLQARDGEPLPTILQDAVQAVLAEPLAESAVERVKERARRLAESDDLHRRPADNNANRHRWGWQTVSRTLLAAAAVLAVATGAVVLFDRSASRAFAQVIERVKSARTVQFTTMSRLGGGREDNGRMYLEGNRVRFDQFDGALVTIGDLEAKRALVLDTRRQVAQSMDVPGDAALEFANPIDQLRSAASGDAEHLGQEMLDGRRADVYRLRQSGILGLRAPEMLVWADVESGLPARIVIRDTDPKAPLEFRFDDFAWNEPIAAAMFALEPPAGFTEGVVVKEPAVERDVAMDVAPDIEHGLLRYRVPAVLLWDPQGKTITALMRDPESASARRGNELCQWDATSGEWRWTQNVRGTNRAAISPDGKTLATVIGFEVQLRDATSGEIVKTWSTDESVGPLAFSPDGKTLAAGITEWGPHGGRGGDSYGGVQLWDVERGTLVRSQKTDDEPVTFVAYSPDGKYLASSSNAGPVKLWDAASGELARVIPARSRGAFSPEGETVACISTASSDANVGRLDLYKIADASYIRSFTTDKAAAASWLLGVAFSPDGRKLAATDWNGTVTLWDVATGQRTRTITEHRGGVLVAAFSPDGTKLATGSEDQTLRLWDVAAESAQ